MSSVSVRPVAEADREAWRVLYRGYRDFYEVAHSDEAIDKVWSWLMDPQHSERGLVAVVDGELVGLAHFRSFARPLAASEGLYLDDLFTSPAARGHGAGSALLERLAETARDEGATVVRWITAESNATAMSLYDKVSKKTPWVTYDLAPAEG